MKMSKAAIALFGALSVFLAGAAAWPLSWAVAPKFLVYLAVLGGALGLFAVILPRRFGQPMQIFIGMALGVLAGWLLNLSGQIEFVTDYLAIFGTVFILLLKLVVIPLIFVSIVCGVAGIGDVTKLGRLGGKALTYYFSTTSVAVLIGLLVVNTIQPGTGREGLQSEAQALADGAESGPVSIGKSIQDSLLPAIIQNPIMADQSPLVIIFFALLLGAALAAKAEAGAAAVAVFRSLDTALVTIVLWIMTLAPLGVFALMAKAIGTLGIKYIVTLAEYCLTVILGLGIHFCFLTLLLVPFLGGVSPWRFLKGMTPAFELAFSTSSSTATLPVTIECAQKRVGADANVCNFMLPIGATINMDGTALYQSVAAIFIAEVYGVGLTFMDQVAIFLTAVLVSVGAAGIPGASVALMALVLKSADIPVEGIGIIVGVDRFLDMCRTLVNVTGDSVGAVVVSRSEGTLSAPGGVS